MNELLLKTLLRVRIIQARDRSDGFAVPETKSNCVVPTTVTTY
jgi:hypothetical protein